MKTPCLILLPPPQPEQRIPITHTPFTLGRDAENNLSLPNPHISSRHAVIQEHLGLYWLEDLGSTNGTWLQPPGGVELRLAQGKPALLLEGAQIRLGGKTLLRVEGVSVSQEDATRQTFQRVQNFVATCYQQMSLLKPEERPYVQEELYRLEAEIRQASSEEELVQCIARRLKELTRTTLCEYTPDETDLPPLPDDLPEPGSPYRLTSLHNLFLSNLRRIFEEQGGKRS